MAVLFRSAYHSFDLEIELLRQQIPFMKFGGFKFMESAHIKDLLAHLRVAANPRDSLSWNRLLQLVPGIGKKSAQKFLAQLKQGEFSLDNGFTMAGLPEKRQSPGRAGAPGGPAAATPKPGSGPRHPAESGLILLRTDSQDPF